ncbi:LAMI_0C06810g1_1 [Lachancea mirantina]|uniref:LAMI_0C06810g1_1 n=1 Tax=Lachancea mirantina TaxID=1230905 RepID=A0A1G4J3E1_9SACH|nr:LAMI_0C06810g1_1 [Lachancea mirantina]
MASDKQPVSSSTSAFVTTLILYGIICIVFVLLFTRLRPKNPRVYQPRALKDVITVPEEERTEEVPAGSYQWAPFLLSKPHSFLIQHAGLDGYLFLRYLSIFGGLSLLGIALLFPILLPVNATNGYNLKGFELLGFSNVKNKNRFYAHVFLSWLYFGLVIYVLFRELYYYVSLRHAVQTSPLMDGLLSSRTMLITELSPDLSNESEMQRRFQNCRSVVFARDHSELEKLCKERAKYAKKYENTLNKVIRKSLKVRRKAEKKGKLEELVKNKPENDLETYIPQNKRPRHRLGKIPLPFVGGEKVDTMEYSCKRIAELNDEINAKQQDWELQDKVGACFLEFKTQLDAQRAYQSVSFVLEKKSYDKCLIGCAPEEVVWSNMGLSRKTRLSKRVVANTLMCLMIIFWAIPVAVVGCISNVNFLTNKVPFLRFINNLPSFLLGLITGILPTVALAILISLVPPFIKLAGRKSGSMTEQEVELYCQGWYYGFLVIQVFLVVTGTSAASATVTDIIEKPSSAMTLLAQNLPKASNFYIAFFLLQGLTIPSKGLLQAVNLIMSKFLGRILDATPRQKWNRYNTLSKPSWGIAYPVMGLLVVIYLCYSIIASIILVFSTMTFAFFVLSYMYNLNYVFGFSFDLRGRNYPKALYQTFVGLYLAEICLIGLFVMAKTWGPVVLEAVFLAFTVLCHLYFQRRFIPLFDAVPLSAIKTARGEPGYVYPTKDQGLREIREVGEQFKEELDQNVTGGVIQPATSADLKRAGILSDASDEENDAHNERHVANVNETEEDTTDAGTKRKSSSINKADLTTTNDTNFVPEDEEFHKYSYDDVKDLKREPPTEDMEANGAVVVNADAGNVFADANAVTKSPAAFPSNLPDARTYKDRLIGFFHPEKYHDFNSIRSHLPHLYNTTVKYDKDFVPTAYADPCVSDPEPIIWIAKDPMGLSTQQILAAKVHHVDVRDDFAGYDEKSRSYFTFAPPDYEPKAKR